MNIYKELEKPIFALSPMEGITDSVFREIVLSSSKPDLVYTEFINVDGFNSVKGKENILKRLKVLSDKVPVVVQLWGLKPENFKRVAGIIRKEFPVFKGIDLNMGCSVKNVLNRGAGAGLMKDYVLSSEIICATKENAGDLPVSVKTRIGYDSVITKEWFSFLLGHDLQVISVHGRTAKQGYSGYSNWAEIGKVVRLRDKMEKDTYIFGNGDIKSLDEATKKIKEYKVDGVLIGRGAWSNPWVFSGRDIKEVPFEEKKSMLLKHIQLYVDVYGGNNICELRKFFKTYINGFDKASNIRKEMMQTRDVKELEEYIKWIKIN